MSGAGPESDLHARVRATLAGRRLFLVDHPPAYGSPAWAALPDTDPAKVRAVIDAAESWRRHCTPEAIAGRLRAELDAIDRAATARVKAAAEEVAGGLDWRRLQTGPDAAAMHRRRYPWLFEPYPLGHRGGAVHWHPDQPDHRKEAA